MNIFDFIVNTNPDVTFTTQTEEQLRGVYKNHNIGITLVTNDEDTPCIRVESDCAVYKLDDFCVFSTISFFYAWSLAKASVDARIMNENFWND